MEIFIFVNFLFKIIFCTCSFVINSSSNIYSTENFLSKFIIFCNKFSNFKSILIFFNLNFCPIEPFFLYNIRGVLSWSDAFLTSKNNPFNFNSKEYILFSSYIFHLQCGPDDKGICFISVPSSSFNIFTPIQYSGSDNDIIV